MKRHHENRGNFKLNVPTREGSWLPLEMSELIVHCKVMYDHTAKWKRIMILKRGEGEREREHMQRPHLVNKWAKKQGAGKSTGGEKKRKKSVFTHTLSWVNASRKMIVSTQFLKITAATPSPEKESERAKEREKEKKTYQRLLLLHFISFMNYKGKMPLYIINSLLLLWLWLLLLLPRRRAADVGGGVITFWPGSHPFPFKNLQDS